MKLNKNKKGCLFDIVHYLKSWWMKRYLGHDLLIINQKRTSNFRFSSKYRFRNTLILSEVATLTSFQKSCYFDVFLKEQNQYRRKIFNKFQLVSRFIKACLRAFQIGTNCPKLWDYIGYYYLNVTRFMNLLHHEDSWRFNLILRHIIPDWY